MLNITIIAVGGLKENYLADACREYQKRISAFSRLEIIEVGEYRLVQNPSRAEIEKCLDAEGKSILRKLPQKAYASALCIEGERMPSESLADRIEKISSENSRIAFIVGGSHGLSDEVKQRVQLKLSMSDMTFPHQLARVMLLEQLYRALSINAGLKYHK